MTTSLPPLTFYPAFCHPASPTYFTWVKIAAVDVHRLTSRSGFEGQNIYFHLNHPIQFIHLAGIITSRDDLPTCTILTLDDSSGESIQVVCPTLLANNKNSNNNTRQDSTLKPPAGSETATHRTYAASTPIDLSPLQPCTRAKVKGTISSFRGVKQVSLERFTVLKTMDEEVRFWEERSRFLVDVLSVPWEVEEGEVRRLRREAEGGAGGVHGGDGKGDRGSREIERKRRREEKEERDRLRLERRYAREEQVRHKLAMRCRAASAGVDTAGSAKR